jgi:hypothetical protein
VKNRLCYTFLLGVKGLSRLFFRPEIRWIDDPGPNWWEKVHLIVLLNHTSLFEPIFLAGVENGLMRRLAEDGLVPVADKTISRPFAGPLFRLFAPDVVPITRRRDHTWEEMTDSIHENSIVVLLPEGRMVRANGLDSQGRPMTVRGGIADLLKVIPDGKILFAYSGGLHHVQIPGQGFPNLFKTIRINFEIVPLGEYREGLGLHTLDPREFKKAVVDDMTRRRDEHCPVVEGTTSRPTFHPPSAS